MKAVIYARISREKQSEYSLSAQVEECKAYIEKERYELGNVYIDDGFSAKNMDRPQLQQMLTDLRQRKFNMIVIWRLDRLTRDTIDGLNMVRNVFKPSGVEFASVMEDIDTSTPDGYMMYTFRLSMAQNEREKIAERVSLGQMKRAQDGKRNSPVRPLGYNVGPDLQLTVNEEESETVRKVFEWYTKGWGYNKIAKTLNLEGVSTAYNGTWDPTRVKQILTNLTYTGVVHYKRKYDPEEKRVIAEGQHDAIISKESFELVQRIMNRKSEGKMNTSSADYPFSTVVKCGICGRSYFGYSKSEDRRYYRCRGKQVYPSCKSSEVSEKKLAEMFLAHLEGFHFTSLQPEKPVTGKDTEREHKRIMKALDEIVTKKKNYTRAMGSGKLDYEMYEELIDEENKRAVALNTELEALGETTDHRITRRDILNRLNNLKQKWPTMSREERKQRVQDIFEVIVINKQGRDWAIVAQKLAD